MGDKAGWVRHTRGGGSGGYEPIMREKVKRPRSWETRPGERGTQGVVLVEVMSLLCGRR